MKKIKVKAKTIPLLIKTGFAGFVGTIVVALLLFGNNKVIGWITGLTVAVLFWLLICYVIEHIEIEWDKK